MTTSGRAMCEAIARGLRNRYGIDITPEQIWNASPTGELWPIYELYEFVQACERGELDEEPA